MLLGLRDLCRGLRAVVRIKSLRAERDGLLGETQIVFGLRQIELRGFEVFLRDAARVVEREPSLINAARIVGGGARVAQSLLILRVVLRNRPGLDAARGGACFVESARGL